jgi:hypothetical protein
MHPHLDCEVSIVAWQPLSATSTFYHRLSQTFTLLQSFRFHALLICTRTLLLYLRFSRRSDLPICSSADLGLFSIPTWGMSLAKQWRLTMLSITRSSTPTRSWAIDLRSQTIRRRRPRFVCLVCKGTRVVIYTLFARRYRT